MTSTARRIVLATVACATLGLGCSSTERSAVEKKVEPQKPTVEAPAPPAAKPAAAPKLAPKEPAAGSAAPGPGALPEVLAASWRPSPPNALAHVGTPRPREIWSLTVSPDGWTAAAACGDGALRLWDLRTHSPGATYWAYAANGLHGVSYAPDGRHLITHDSHGDAGALLWDTRRMTPQRRLPGKAPNSVAWTAGGRFLALSHTDPGNLVQLIDPRTGEIEAAVTPNKKGDLVFALATPDGKHLLVAQENELQIWAVEGAKLEVSLELGSSSVAYHGALSADGKLLVAVGGKPSGGMEGDPERPMVYVMDLTTRTWRGQLPHDARSLDAFALAPDGKTAVAAAGEQLLIWRTDATVPIPGPEEADDADEGGDGAGVARKKPRLPIPRTALPAQLKHGARVTALVFTPSSRAFLAADEKGEVRLWELGQTGARGPAPRAREAARWHVWGKARQGHTAAVKAVALSADSKSLWTRAGETLRWDLSTLRPARGGTMPATMASASCSGLTRSPLRGTLPQALQRRIKGACDNKECVDDDCEAFQAQETVWVSANRAVAIAQYSSSWEGTKSDTTPGTLEVWGTGPRGEQKQEINISEGSVLALSADGKLAALWESMQHKLNVYDLTRAEETKVCQLAADKTLGSGPDVAAFSPDGARVAAAYGGKVTLWKVAGCAVHETLTTTVSSFSALGFSADGGTLAAGLDDGTALTLRLNR